MNNDILNEFDERNKKLGKKLVSLSAIICGNQKNDPPIKDINDIMFDIANTLVEDIKINGRLSELSIAIEKKFKETMMIVMPQLISKENGLNATELHVYFMEKLATMDNHTSLGDNEMKETMNLVTETNLFIHQRIREMEKSGNREEVIYSDKEQYRKIGLLCEITDLSGTSQRLVDEIDDAFMWNVDDFYAGRIVRVNREKASRRQ